MILSCNSDDDNNDSSGFLNPPQWIIGTWMDQSEPVYAQIGGFQFTDDNMISYNSDGEVLSNLKNEMQDAVDQGILRIEETSTSTVYEIKIISNETVSNQYKFRKGANNNSIVYDLSVIYDIILTKQ